MARQIISGIYGIINKINKQIYVGQSIDIFKQWGRHRSALRNNKHKNKHLQASWNKYGEAAFEFVVLELVKNHNMLTAYEQKYVDYYRTFKGVYNTEGPVETPNRGRKMGPMSPERLKKHTESLPRGEDHPYHGRKLDPEHNAKLQAGRMASPHPVMTPEGKERIRLANLGRQFSQETKEKMAKAKRGGKASQDTKDKMSEAHTGVLHTEENKQKMSMIKKERDRKEREAKQHIFFPGAKF